MQCGPICLLPVRHSTKARLSSRSTIERNTNEALGIGSLGDAQKLTSEDRREGEKGKGEIRGADRGEVQNCSEYDRSVESLTSHVCFLRLIMM